jgi:hypothetical protein
LLLALLASCARAPAAASSRGAPGIELSRAARGFDPARLKGAPAFGRSALLAVEAGVAGDRVSALLELAANRCAVIIARGGGSIEDLDLLLYGEDGTPLGTDEAPDAEPALLICPPHPRRIFASARIAQGHGVVALGAEAVPPEHAKNAAKRYGVKPREPGDPQRLKAWPGLDDMVMRERERLGGRFRDLRRVALALDASLPTTLPATIAAGRCVHGLFIPSQEVSHLDVAALDDQGRVLGRAAGSGRSRTMIVCSSVETSIAFEVRPHVGRGLAVAALSQSLPGTESEIVADIIRYEVYPDGDPKTELAELEARLEKFGYSAGRLTQRLELTAGRRSSVGVELFSGCTRIDVVGGTPLRGVQLRLWKDDALWGESSGAGSASVFACGSAGKARLDLSAALRGGPVLVVTRTERDVPAELSRSPLAAGRLVSRMLARGVLRRPSSIGKVRELTLEPARLVTLDELVPLERCLDVTLALEAGAAGAELRAVDADTGIELDAAVGEDAASVRACAHGRGSKGSLNVRLELRTAFGSATALLAARQLAPVE